MTRYTIKEILNTDSTRRVVVFQLKDGRFSFREERLIPNSSPPQWGVLWNPAPKAYQTEELAERGALSDIKWAAAVIAGKG